jgi:hypothetical protein
MRKIGIAALLFHIWAIAAGLCVSPAMAKNQAEIVHIQIGQNTANLDVSFRIQNCFTPEMEEAIQSGVPTTFRIRVLLEKPGFLLLRSKVSDSVLEHSIKYDRLKNEYLVQLAEDPESVRITGDFDEAKQLMGEVRRLPIVPLWQLEKGQSYQLSLKAELSKVRLPLFFRYIFYFVSLWDFETSWQKVTFSL